MSDTKQEPRWKLTDEWEILPGGGTPTGGGVYFVRRDPGGPVEISFSGDPVGTTYYFDEVLPGHGTRDKARRIVVRSAGNDDIALLPLVGDLVDSIPEVAYLLQLRAGWIKEGVKLGRAAYARDMRALLDEGDGGA